MANLLGMDQVSAALIHKRGIHRARRGYRQDRDKRRPLKLFGRRKGDGRRVGEELEGILERRFDG